MDSRPSETSVTEDYITVYAEAPRPPAQREPEGQEPMPGIAAEPMLAFENIRDHLEGLPDDANWAEEATACLNNLAYSLALFEGGLHYRHCSVCHHCVVNMFSKEDEYGPFVTDTIVRSWVSPFCRSNNSDAQAREAQLRNAMAN
eukprot:1161683-Amphidinium_carterae.1